MRYNTLQILILLLVMSLWLTSFAEAQVGKPSQNIAVFTTAYNEALSAKDIPKMKEALDSIIAFQPDDWEARRQRSFLAWETGDWESLEADYNALARHYPSNVQIFERRGLLRWYLGKIDSACWDFRYVQIFTSGLHSQYSHLTKSLCNFTLETRGTMNVLEDAVFREINALRERPAAYIQAVEEEFAMNSSILAPREGMIVLREVVQTLINTPSLNALKYALPLKLAAQDHADDLGQHRHFGHRGTDGSLPDERLQRYAFHRKSLGENIGYGAKSARTLVVGLLLDDGIQGRGHRVNILNPAARSIGIGTAEHAVYPCVCVQMFEEAQYPSK